MGLGSEVSLRAKLSELLYEAGVFGLRDDDIEEAFIQGERDPSLADIGMDSLSRMEFCIAVENDLGVSIVPTALEELETLEEMVQLIQQELKT